MRFILFACLTGTAFPAHCGDWRMTWDGTAYGYAVSTQMRQGNLPGNSRTLDARFDFKAEKDGTNVALRPILLARDNPGSAGSVREAYLSQWQIRIPASDAWNVSIGRDLMNWGPAQFRSPSSPFYFDNGRNDPLQELSGMDNVKAVWTPDLKTNFTLARITGSGHAASDPWKNSWLVKTDRVSENWTGSLIYAQAPGSGPFIGILGQYTLQDALLVYAEASSYRRKNALQSPSDSALPFSLQPLSPRRIDALTGASWTFQNGNTLYAEYLHYGHGYDPSQITAFFSRAPVSPPLIPPLLGRDYVHLVLQSNLMETGGYWRLMLTGTDRGSELSAYGEHAMNGRIALFLMAAFPGREFSPLFSRSLTLGLKFALQ